MPGEGMKVSANVMKAAWHVYPAYQPPLLLLMLLWWVVYGCTRAADPSLGVGKPRTT
jgi:hypothetical protein